MNKEILQKFNSHGLVVGVDEVGRGPIAGPVTICAFGVQEKYYIDILERLAGITDSKKLTEKRRDFYAGIIRDLQKDGKIEIAITSVSAKKIDSHGISAALRAALKKSVIKITENFKNPFIYLDGSLHADEKFSQKTIIKGDSKNWLIGAASVVAKVARDQQMKKFAMKYPHYGFEQHKGYGTKKHYESIDKHGVCDIHRKTWIKNRNL